MKNQAKEVGKMNTHDYVDLVGLGRHTGSITHQKRVTTRFGKDRKSGRKNVR